MKLNCSNPLQITLKVTLGPKKHKEFLLPAPYQYTAVRQMTWLSDYSVPLRLEFAGIYTAILVSYTLVPTTTLQVAGH